MLCVVHDNLSAVLINGMDVRTEGSGDGDRSANEPLFTLSAHKDELRFNTLFLQLVHASLCLFDHY